MIIVNSIAGASAAAGAIWLVASSLIVARRLRGKPPAPAPARAAKVALIRPVSGSEYELEAALRSSFALTYPSVEILFCVEDERDAAVPTIRRLIAEHPAADARLLIGRDRLGANPKINNIAKAWRATDAEWIAIADSNAVLQADFIEGVMECWSGNRGVVSTPTLMIEPDGLAAEVEAAFVNLAQTRVAVGGDLFAFNAVFGKTMLWRRETMDRIGGLEAVAQEFGDDVIARKLVKAAGMTARVGRPIPQRAGPRSWRTVWGRQLRWLRVLIGPAKPIYFLSFFCANILPMFWVGVLTMTGALPFVALPVFIVAWYAVECALALAVGWPMSWRMPLALAIRDLLFFPLWIAGLFPARVAWRGNVKEHRGDVRVQLPATQGEREPGGGRGAEVPVGDAVLHQAAARALEPSSAGQARSSAATASSTA